MRDEADPDKEPRGREEISLHSSEDFEGMRKAGRLAAALLEYAEEFVVPGVTTEELDRLCLDYILSHGATSPILHYRGFPKAICTSVNHVVCHGIPGGRRLMEGDIVNVDVTVLLDGWHGDTSRTFLVGEVSLRAKKLVDTAYAAMMRGISVIKPGTRFGAIGHAIQSLAELQRYSVVRDFCGHGIGRTFHGSPNVLNYGKLTEGVEMKEGMFFTVEPMINSGRPEVKTLSDGWTAVTRDRSLSAQFEHTVGVTADGVEIFTVLPGRDMPALRRGT
jgi:methionyl aminopeptidase